MQIVEGSVMLLRRRLGVYCSVVLSIYEAEGWSDLGANALHGRYAVGEGSAVIDAFGLTWVEMFAVV